MSNPENNTNYTEAAAQAAEIEEKAKAAPSFSVYTHKFEEPFRYNGKTYDQLTFDFGRLTGRDSMASEREVNAQGITLVVKTFDLTYLCGMAARACTERDSRGFAPIDSDALADMPCRDFNAITDKTRSFLLRQASLRKTEGS